MRLVLSAHSMRMLIHVFTFKAGLLARVAHDLQLTVERFAFTVHQRRVVGHCDANSLRIDGAVTPHGLEPGTPDEADKRQILQTVRSEILAGDRHPRVELQAELRTSNAARVQLVGTLTLRGRTQPIEAEFALATGSARAAFELVPSRFGIAPYKALAGAIRLQDRVRVEVQLDLGDRSFAQLLDQAEPLQLTAANA